MKKYTEMTKDELMQEKTALEAEYEKIKNLGLSLDMSQGILRSEKQIWRSINAKPMEVMAIGKN